VLLLIQKASERGNDESDGSGEEVRVSISEDKDGLSFNMNPFL
jgi:hypothetical protein